MKKRIILIVLLGFLVVLQIGVTYSFFLSKSNLVANQEIAKFVFDAEDTSTISLPITNLNPGDDVSYSFEVSNNVNDVVSQVNIKYQMTIKTHHLMPLEIKLFKLGESEELVLNCDEKFSRNENNQLICNSDVQSMPYNNEVLESYRLDVEFPNEYNDENYSELVDYIDIDINSWQDVSK